VGLAATEHDIELREPEHERIALIDEGDPYRAGKRLGQPRYQLETAEPSSEDYHVLIHNGRVTKRDPGR
jgi:hypothetical protein